MGQYWIGANTPLVSAALGAAITTYGVHWTLTLACVVLGVALVPLLFGQDPAAAK